MLDLIVVLIFLAVVAAAEIKDARVAVCAVLKDDQLYVDEWLRYHRFLGFDAMHLYDNNENPSKYLAGLHLIFGDFVTVKRLPPAKDLRESAYGDCFETFKTNNTWAAFINVDDFIVLRKHGNIKGFLQSVAPTGGAVVLNWSQFSNDGAQNNDISRPVLARFTHTTKSLDPHTKTIAYLGHVESIDAHHLELHANRPTVDPLGRAIPDDSTDRGNITSTKEIACVNRYYTKSLKEFKLKMRGSSEASTSPTEEEVQEEFEKHNAPLHEVRDTFALQFYMRQYLSKVYYEPLPQKYEL